MKPSGEARQWLDAAIPRVGTCLSDIESEVDQMVKASADRPFFPHSGLSDGIWCDIAPRDRETIMYSFTDGRASVLEPILSGVIEN